MDRDGGWTSFYFRECQSTSQFKEHERSRNVYVRAFYQFSLIFRHHSGFHEVEEKYCPLPALVYNYVTLLSCKIYFQVNQEEVLTGGALTVYEEVKTTDVDVAHTYQEISVPR